MPNPTDTVDLDYASMPAKKLRGLYAKGVRNEHTRKASADYQRAAKARKRAEDAAAETSGGGEDIATSSANEGDTAADTPAGMGATTGTPEPGTAPRNLTPPEPTRHTSPVTVSTTSVRGTVRRLRGLAMIGVTPARVAEVTRIHVGDIWWLLMKPPAMIPVQFHNRVSDAFRNLRLGPITPNLTTIEGRAAAQIIALAEDHHWAGPFDWDHIDTDDTPVATHRHRDADFLQAAIDSEPAFEPLPASIDERDLEEARAQAANLEARITALTADLERARTETRDARGQLVVEQRLTAELRTTISSQARTIGGLQDAARHDQEQYELAVKAGDQLLEEKQRLDQLLTDLTTGARAQATTEPPATVVEQLGKLISPLVVSGITMHVTIGEPR